MYEDVLVPTDGGDRMGDVIEQALDVARHRDATVHALSVVDERAFLTLDDELTDEVASELRTEAEAAIEEVVDSADAAGVPIEAAIRRGKPAAEIESYARTIDADLIVVGSRGAGSYEQNLLGSVSQTVVSGAERPVLTVPLAGDG